MITDERTPKAKQLHSMLMATMNIDLHELVDASVIDDVGDHFAWEKWNKNPAMFVAKLPARKLNALAALIYHKFPSSFGGKN